MRPRGKRSTIALIKAGILPVAQLAVSLHPILRLIPAMILVTRATRSVKKAPRMRKKIAPRLTPPRWMEPFRPATSETTSKTSSGTIIVEMMRVQTAFIVVIQARRFPNMRFMTRLRFIVRTACMLKLIRPPSRRQHSRVKNMVARVSVVRLRTLIDTKWTSSHPRARRCPRSLIYLSLYDAFFTRYKFIPHARPPGRRGAHLT